MKNKQAASDFTIDKLPKNRWEVFLDCLKERYLLFLAMGLTLLIFALPLLFVTLLSDNTLGGLYLSLINGDYTQEEYTVLVQSANSMYSLFFIPCYMALAVGASGVIMVIRQLVWGEGVFYMQDLFDGIKSNGIYYTLIALILGLLVYLQNTYLPIQSNVFLIAIPIIASLLILPTAGFMFSQIAIYKNHFFRYALNGFSLYIRTVPKTLLFLVLFLIPAVLSMNLLPFLAKYIIVLLFFLFLAPMLLTGWFLYSCSVFDKYVNKEQYPEIYDKGVYRKEKTVK